MRAAPTLALASLLLLALLPAAARALEVDDLRVSYAPLVGREFTASGKVVDLYTGNDFEQDVQVSTEAEYHRRFGLEYRRSLGALKAGFGAPLLGVELSEDRIREHQGTITFTGESQMLDVVAGWAWKVRPGWHVEQGIIGGIGHAHWRQQIPQFFQDGADWDSGSSGFAYEYGLSVGTYYAYDDHLEVGLDVRHLVMRSRGHFFGFRDLGGGSFETASFDGKFETRGFGITLATGYRF